MPLSLLSLPQSARGRPWAGRQRLSTVNRLARGMILCVTGEPKSSTEARDVATGLWAGQLGSAEIGAGICTGSDFGVAAVRPGGVSSGTYIGLGASTLFDGSEGGIACWFKPRAHGTDQVAGAGALSAVFGRADGDGGGAHVNGVMLYYDHGTPGAAVAKLEGGGTTVTLTGTTNLSLNVWYHLALTWTDGGTCTLYVNGVAEDSDTAPTVDWTYDFIQFGQRGSNNTFVAWPNCHQTIAAWWNRALAADEVRELYQDPWAAFEEDGGFAWFDATPQDAPRRTEAFTLSDNWSYPGMLRSTVTDALAIAHSQRVLLEHREGVLFNDSSAGGFTLPKARGTLTDQVLFNADERSDSGQLSGERYRR